MAARVTPGATDAWAVAVPTAIVEVPDAIRQAIARVAHRGGRARRFDPTSVGVSDIGCSSLSGELLCNLQGRRVDSEMTVMPM